MNILFIGNSYTYYNDMPTILQRLAEENGKTVRIDAVTKGGRKLYENLTADDEKSAEICALLAKNEYDVLILQEQSYFALVDYEKFEYGVTELVGRVSAKHNLLYATWGRKKGCELLTQYGWTTDEMTDLLEDAYRMAADAAGADVSPVGRCFRRVSELLPDVDLYNPDLSHPSYAGSCVAAVAHYAKLFAEPPRAVSALKLDRETAETIVTAVGETVFSD